MSIETNQKCKSSLSNIIHRDTSFKRLTPTTQMNANELSKKIVYIKNIHPTIKKININLSQVHHQANMSQPIVDHNISCVKPVQSKLNLSKCFISNDKKRNERPKKAVNSCFKDFGHTTKNLIVKLNDPTLKKEIVKAVPLNSPREDFVNPTTAAFEFQTKLTESNVGIKYHFKKDVVKKLVNPFSNKPGSVRLKDLIPARLGMKSGSSAQSNPSPFQSTTSNTCNYQKISPDFVTNIASETEFMKNEALKHKPKLSPRLEEEATPLSNIKSKKKDDLLYAMSKYNRQETEISKIAASNLSISEKMFNTYFEQKGCCNDNKPQLQIINSSDHNQLLSSKLSEESIFNISGKKCKT